MNITPPVRNKIQKYIDTHELLVQQDTIYILCTDSKGIYLNPFIPHTYQDSFIWWDKEGRETEDGVNFIIFFSMSIRLQDYTHKNKLRSYSGMVLVILHTKHLTDSYI